LTEAVARGAAVLAQPLNATTAAAADAAQMERIMEDNGIDQIPSKASTITVTAARLNAPLPTPCGNPLERHARVGRWLQSPHQQRERHV
jgi:hypothetical protein